MSTPEQTTPPPEPGSSSATPEPVYVPAGEEPAFSEHGASLIREEEDFRESELGSDMDVAAVHGEMLRESQGRNPGFVQISSPLLIFLGAVLLWAGVYLGEYSGGFKADIFNPEPGAGGAAPAPVDPKVVGERLFTANCAVCHQATGLGLPGQYPPLAGSEWVIGDAPNRLTQILLHGIQGQIHVKGAVFNNQMPTWSTLKDEQIADILTYVRSAWGNNVPPITPEEMTLARKETTARTDSWSEGELLKIPAGAIHGGDAAAKGAPAAPKAPGQPAAAGAAAPAAPTPEPAKPSA